MSFRVKPDGSVEVDTAAELRQVLKIHEEQREAKTAPRRAAPIHARPTATRKGQTTDVAVPALFGGDPGPYQRFYRELPGPQRMMLAALLDAANGLTDDELRSILNLASNVALRGLLISISKKAKNAGLAMPVDKDMTRTNGGRGRSYRYRATRAFRDAIQEMTRMAG